ncbi:type II toxin-antitoxin system RelE/ParE family toxin [Dyadobacter sp. CY345]|uniref:type II toxin-antitoxin system RelE/ParE family toxin n=1 Tax=Dyadobacter sp. CY345 TaxID=2909335 RepID=UPI001F481036|nr:type II toxin-antitoxin system RelE/ParE family toxin [Dyadobacter sp. CY345]MCF2442872.1 type II toxin-antitoxin system RelE/ParE family toxin [Dyadobacter sp. CY345]
MVDHYSVVWDKNALEHLSEIYHHILKDSYQNAQKVRLKILEQTAQLKEEPWRHNADKLRLDKNPAFRAFEIYRFRITYYINKDAKSVSILRVRSTWQEPLLY